MSKYRPYKRITIIRAKVQEPDTGQVNCPKEGKRVSSCGCFTLFCTSCVARGDNQVFCSYGVEVYSHDKTRTT